MWCVACEGLGGWGVTVRDTMSRHNVATQIWIQFEAGRPGGGERHSGEGGEAAVRDGRTVRGDGIPPRAVKESLAGADWEVTPVRLLLGWRWVVGAKKPPPVWAMQMEGEQGLLIRKDEYRGSGPSQGAKQRPTARVRVQCKSVSDKAVKVCAHGRDSHWCQH